MTRAGYKEVDHTADLALAVWAPSEPELLRQGALAVSQIMVGGRPIAGSQRRAVRVEAAIDPGDRLVQWLNEVIYAAVTHGFVCRDARVQLSPGGLHGELVGQDDAADHLATELKSATYHELELVHENDGWRAFVVIDV